MKLDLRKLTGRAKLIKNVSATNPPRGTKVAQQWEARRGTTKTINAYQVSGAGAGQIKIKIRRISENPDYTLLGHEDNVCALDAGPGGSYINSGSWDKALQYVPSGPYWQLTRIGSSQVRIPNDRRSLLNDTLTMAHLHLQQLPRTRLFASGQSQNPPSL